MFNQRKPRPEHLEQLIACLKGRDLITPLEITKVSSLTLTATNGAIEELERQGKLVVVRQNKTPRTQVKLSD